MNGTDYELTECAKTTAIRCGVALLLVCLIALIAPSGAQLVRAAEVLQSGSATQPDPQQVFVVRYCISCHNQRLKTAGLMLDRLDVLQVGPGAEQWEKVLRKLASGAMPPPGRPRPDAATQRAFVDRLEASLNNAAATDPNPGRTDTFHRLNRAEYRNAVEDLLGLRIDASLLPADPASASGFDNMSLGLSISPALMERYVSTARRISRLAVGVPPNSPSATTYKALEDAVDDGDRLSEDLPFGSRGGAAIRHLFPVNGEYVIKVRLQTNSFEYFRGLDYPHRLDVRVDGVRVKQFMIGGEGKGAPAPLSYAGRTLMDSEWESYMKVRAGAGLEVRLPIKAGPHVIGVSFVREQWEYEGIQQPRIAGHALDVSEMADDNPNVDTVVVSGPFTVSGTGGTPSYRQVVTCEPAHAVDEEGCAERILSRLVRRAYRRPATEADVATLLTFYRAGRKEGTFVNGIQEAIERLLVDPEFLFRIEREPKVALPATGYPVSDLELASRLSFFLWSSIPDDELLDAAARGTLSDPGGVERQVRRMFRDRRASKAIVENFAGQWLLLRNLQSVVPDPVAYPTFDDNLREAFQRETELFLADGLREDRSVVDLLSADYTYVNERLARHYGIPGVYGNGFRRIELSGHRLGGLLGHGSLLTATSYPNRTSPVLRGKFLLDNILGSPPPPPPANVPALPDRGVGGKAASVRERIEEHRKNPVCAACHASMDPLGFALENFDGVGKWRTHESDAPIDASGALPTGVTFDGPAEFQAVLLKQREQFVRTVVEKLLVYAIGRDIEYYDVPVVRKIARDAAADDYRWSSIVLGIVQSLPFRMRRSM